MADFYELEDGSGHYLLEDDSGSLLTEEQSASLGDGECAVEQEASEELILLEDGSFLLLETCVDAVVTGDSGGHRLFGPPRPRGTQPTPPLHIRAPAARLLLYANRPMFSLQLGVPPAGAGARAAMPTPRIRITPADAEPVKPVRMTFRATQDHPKKLDVADVWAALEAARKRPE